MANELRKNLSSYRLQLQQVEATLTNEPENEELKKLKLDLEEVIQLTCDFLKSYHNEGRTAGAASAERVLMDEPLLDDIPILPIVRKDWKVGDRCLAPWSVDRQYYEATIEGFTKDKEKVTVIFDNYNNLEVTNLSSLKELKTGNKAREKLKRQLLSKQREQQKKQIQKKIERYKQLEEEREGGKFKWLAFKQSSQGSRKGMTKKSIFASPENVNGRVGIGTCGVSGKQANKFHMHKEKKGM